MGTVLFVANERKINMSRFPIIDLSFIKAMILHKNFIPLAFSVNCFDANSIDRSIRVITANRFRAPILKKGEFPL